MANKKTNLSEHQSTEIPIIKEKKIGIVVSEWNENITYSLRDACIMTLQKHGIQEDEIFISYVPGAFELPLGARYTLAKDKLDAVICLGCVIKGDTKHDEYISNAVAQGIMSLGLTSGKPIIFGLLTPNDMDQAEARAGGDHGNKGVEAALTAIKMIHLNHLAKEQKKGIGY